DVTTTVAVSSSPLSSTTPLAWPVWSIWILATRALVLIVAPNSVAALAMALATAPMPPSGKPQLPSRPSPTSPIEWCAITYAVPGSYGPAQVPITPLTAGAPLICGLSNQSSSRSAIDIVISRVTSAIVLVVSPRWRQASLSVSARSLGWREPKFGGTVSRSGPSTSERPPSQAFHLGYCSASFLDHLAISS